MVRPMQQYRYLTVTLITGQHNILIDEPDKQILSLRYFSCQFSAQLEWYLLKIKETDQLYSPIRFKFTFKLALFL